MSTLRDYGYAIELQYPGVKLYRLKDSCSADLPRGNDISLFESYNEAKEVFDRLQHEGRKRIIRISEVPGKFIVSRHPGTIKWLKLVKHYYDAEVVPHIDGVFIEMLMPGDIVVGNLPYHLAAKVCARGAKLLVVEFDVPQDLRGKELSAQDLIEIGAELVEYVVVRKY